MTVSLKKPNDDLDKFLLRMPDGLRERIKREADKNKRSMNAEIVGTLEDAYPEKSLNYPEFMEEWMIPIAQASSPMERKILLDEANDFLRSAADGETHLSTRTTENGDIEAVLVMGHVRLVVGKATAEIADS